jgi:hypothetical protein
MLDSALDVLGYLIVFTFLASFSLWVLAYFGYEMVKHAMRGPSPQLRSLGTSILDEPPYVAPVALDHSLVPLARPGSENPSQAA